MAGKRVLITGGTGFLGNNIIPVLLERGFEVTNLGRSAYRDTRVTNLHFDALRDDIKEVLDGKSFDFILHLLSYSTPKIAVDFEETKKVNVDLTRGLFQWAASQGVPQAGRPRVYFFSTAIAYAPKEEGLIAEDHPLQSSKHDFYTASKIEGEGLCKEFKAKGLPVSVLRLTNCFGPNQAWQGYPNLVPQLVRDAIEKEQVTIFNGDYSRDFLFAGDLASIVVKLLELDKDFDVLNVASGGQTSVEDIAEWVGKYRRVKVYDLKKELGKSKALELDVSKLEEILGGPVHRTPLKKAMKLTVKHYEKEITPILQKVSFILPTYNERDHIVTFLREIQRAMGRANLPYELILVDDDSPDGTGDYVREYFEGTENVRVIVRKGERGLGTAILRGVNESTGSHVFLMDTDFNHDPKYIEQFLILGRYYDVVSGSRYMWGGDMEGGKLRYIGSMYFNRFMATLLRMRSTDNTGGYVLFRKSVLKRMVPEKIFRGYGEFYFRFLYAVKLLMTSIIEIPVIYPARASGASKTYFSKYIFIYTFECLRLLLGGRSLINR
jgi:dolichol-phosphate mannosyltransferase